VKAAALALALMAAGCAGGPGGGGAYGPSTGGAGYAETRIERDRFQVRFRGTSSMRRDRVELYALHRAAELTLAEGGGHFVVVDRAVEADERVVTTQSFRFSDYYYSRRRPRGGFGFAPSGVTAQAITRYDAILEIVIGEGPKPEGAVEAYDAQEVLALLGPQIRRRAT
jgi:hypothetical protein